MLFPSFAVMRFALLPVLNPKARNPLMDHKIRIAYLIDTICSDKAGTEKQMLQILARLDRDRFAPTLICLYESPFMSGYKFPCTTVCLGYRGFLKPGFPLVLWRYLRELRKGRFQVVQTFFEDSIFVGFLGKVFSLGGHALVVSRRDLGLGADEPSYHSFFKKVLPWLLRSVDGIATNAQAIKKHLELDQNIAPESIKVIANGLELPGSKGSMPQLFKEHPGDLWIGIVANLKPVKRLDVFLRAQAYLNDAGIGVHVRSVVLGAGQLRAELEQLVIDLGIEDRVHFIGAIDYVNDYLQYIDIGVLCSDNEGLPNAVLEYMACGLPVVATEVGGICELVDGTNGICVPPGDYIALGQSLARLVASGPLRKSLGAKSLEKIQNGFIWGIIMPQWVSYYNALAHKKVIKVEYAK
jgi:L-malate glycosyltransferase